MVAPGWCEKPKPEKRSRWQRFKSWAYYHDFWPNLGAALICTIILGGLLFVGWLLFKPDPKDGIKTGVVVDKGAIRPGKSSGKYSYWIDVESNEVTATWQVSDTYYERISIGDYVEKGKLPEEDDGK